MMFPLFFSFQLWNALQTAITPYVWAPVQRHVRVSVDPRAAVRSVLKAVSVTLALSSVTTNVSLLKTAAVWTPQAPTIQWV